MGAPFQEAPTFPQEATTDDIRQWWYDEREKHGRAHLHNALDQILNCPYDELKLTLATCLDGMLLLKRKYPEGMDRETIDAA